MPGILSSNPTAQNPTDSPLTSFDTDFLQNDNSSNEEDYATIWVAIKDEINSAIIALQNELTPCLLPYDIDIPYYVDFDKCIQILINIYFKYSLLKNYCNQEIIAYRFQVYVLFSILLYKIRLQNSNPNIFIKIIALIELAHSSNMPYTDVWLENAYALLVKYWLEKNPEKAINIATHAAKLRLSNASSLLLMAYEELLDRFTAKGKFAEAIKAAIQISSRENLKAKHLVQKTFNIYFQQTKSTLNNIVESYGYAFNAIQLEIPAAQNYLNLCYENYLQIFSERKIDAEFINNHFLCFLSFSLVIALDNKIDPILKKKLLMSYYQNYVIYEKLYKEREKLAEFRNQVIFNTYNFLLANPEDIQTQQILLKLIKNKILFELLPKFAQSNADYWQKELDGNTLDYQTIVNMLAKLMTKTKIRTKIESEWNKDMEMLKHYLQIFIPNEKQNNHQSQSVTPQPLKSSFLSTQSLKVRDNKDSLPSQSLFFEKAQIIDSAPITPSHPIANDSAIKNIYKIALGE